MNRSSRIGVIALFVLAACSQAPASSPTNTAAQPPATTVAEATIPSPSSPPVATAEQSAPPPAATTVPENAPGATNILGVRVSLPSQIATDISGETVPAVGIGDAQAPSWAIMPEHRRLTLQGYPDASEAVPATISVFPVDAYQSASPDVAGSLNALRELLDAQTPNPDAIPVIPLVNAAQVFRAQVQYLPFTSGRGVRFVTFYAQNAAPLANPGLLYVYQGLSDDGRYLVSATLPISAAVIDSAAPGVPFPPTNASGIVPPQAYQAYVASVTQQINSLGSADFTPDLAQLDALVQSITIE